MTLRFNGGETLQVWNPSGVTARADGLRIARADRLRWEWFYYGRPPTEANRYAINYVFEADGTITVADSADWYEPVHDPDPKADAVAYLTYFPNRGPLR